MNIVAFGLIMILLPLGAFFFVLMLDEWLSQREKTEVTMSQAKKSILVFTATTSIVLVVFILLFIF